MACCSCSARVALRPSRILAPSARAVLPAASSSSFPASSSLPTRRSHSTSSKPVTPQDSLPHLEGSSYRGHVPINWFQRGLLTVGSAVMGLVDTHRHGESPLPQFHMVAVLSETSAPEHSLRRLQATLRSTPSGRAILRERPRITEESINVERLGQLPAGTFGKAYYDWLRRNKVTPDTRDPVRYIDDPELAYIMQRYRESHDFYHVLLGFGVSLPAELVVKWFELANFNLPVAALSGLFGPLRIQDRDERSSLWRTYGPWALKAGGKAECLISVYWEREWETPIHELRDRWGVERPPVGFKQWRDEQRRIRALKDEEEHHRRRRAPMQGEV
ncbi:hypothetical protein BMF94_6012 [Rhodotorula taiwanensis]|uniref:4-hydroxy-3-methoxy-5-polyprenylbenzoate decarboxylase n=1 Tax=Rhodotorula taiwanensis TaxID=741276 RepID=A0A2S5B2J4_9BASI|nr:hypothetical protein BMF94_6012 [Rhodotorula taiwanensis]